MSRGPLLGCLMNVTGSLNVKKNKNKMSVLIMPFNVTRVNIGTFVGLSSSISVVAEAWSTGRQRRRLWKAFWFPSPYSVTSAHLTEFETHQAIHIWFHNAVSLNYDHEQVKPSNLWRSQWSRCRLACSVCLNTAELSQLPIFWNRYGLTLGTSRYSC